MTEPPPRLTSLAFPGATLTGKYRLNAVLGVGGMGAVWSALHLGLNQEVAVKLISLDLVRSPEALKRFDREAKAAAQMRSRHIPQVYDNGMLEDGTPYIVMELLHGESLFTRIHKKGPVPLPEAVNVLAQCGRALARAHSIGIIHRDIKPDNIFLAESVDDAGVLVKILDFGIAKLKDGGDGSQSTTRTGALLGTPLYMSPEQARGQSSLDHRTDVYSLGLVAYTMLTGNLAFSGNSFGDLLIQICTQPLPSLVAAAPWLPPALEPWFQKACARTPDERFPTAAAFVDALIEAAGVGPVNSLGGGIASGGASAGALRQQFTPPSVGLDRTLDAAGVGAVPTQASPQHAHAPAAQAIALASSNDAIERDVTTTGGAASEQSATQRGSKGSKGRAIAIAAVAITTVVGLLVYTRVPTGGSDAASPPIHAAPAQTLPAAVVSPTLPPAVVSPTSTPAVPVIAPADTIRIAPPAEPTTKGAVGGASTPPTVAIPPIQASPSKPAGRPPVAAVHPAVTTPKPASPKSTPAPTAIPSIPVSKTGY